MDDLMIWYDDYRWECKQKNKEPLNFEDWWESLC